MLEGMLGAGARRPEETEGVGGRPQRPPTLQATRSDSLARLCAVSLAGAGRPLRTDPETLAEATAVARVWLELLDSGRYAVSWTTTAPALQDAIFEDDWHTALRTTRAPLGRCVSRRLRARAVFEAPGRTLTGPYVVMRFEGRFEHRGGGVIETVTTHQGHDGRWRVAAYFVG